MPSIAHFFISTFLSFNRSPISWIVASEKLQSREELVLASMSAVWESWEFTGELEEPLVVLVLVARALGSNMSSKHCNEHMRTSGS